MKKMLLLKYLTATTLGWLSGTAAFAQSPLPVYLDENEPLEVRVTDALSRLTLEEKVALCHAQSKFSSKGVARLGIPELWMSDGPHGVREEILWDSWGAAGWTNDSCTAFPALTALAATFDPEMAYLYGKAVGEEARYRNKNVLLGPGVNIYRIPLNGRNFEYLGEDPYLASVMVVPYIRGVQENGVAACIKHFALNNQETDRGGVDVEVSDRALREIYLPAFRAAVVEGGVWSLMGAYNRYRGQHCCHNAVLLNDILKGEWRFDGAVISDWSGTHSTLEAAENGLDIEMGTGTDGLTRNTTNAYDSYYLAQPYLQMLREGKANLKTLDDKARRVLRLIFRTAMNRNRPWGSLATEAHADAGRRIAEAGNVLLKNEGNLLPLETGRIRSVAVVGENAVRGLTHAGGSSELKVKREVSPLEGIRNRFGKTVKITHTLGYASGPSSYGRVNPSPLDADSLRREAVKRAREADMVLFVGGLNKNHGQDCEGGDRESYDLPFGQNELIEALRDANPNVVVMLVSGNAVAMPWIDRIPAVVQAWYGGSEAGNAIASVLSGDVNPSGKLPFTFPVRLEDNGAFAGGSLSYPGENHRQVYAEDILVGYRWHDTKGIPPLFPFGHGLSYTTFDYGAPVLEQPIVYGTCDTIRLGFTLENTGKRAGAEAVQLYVGKPDSSVFRAEKELKAFCKVFLRPGEKKRIALTVPVASLAYYHEGLKDWLVEGGDYLLSLSASSGDIRHRIPVEISLPVADGTGLDFETETLSLTELSKKPTE